MMNCASCKSSKKKSRENKSPTVAKKLLFAELTSESKQLDEIELLTNVRESCDTSNEKKEENVLQAEEQEDVHLDTWIIIETPEESHICTSGDKPCSDNDAKKLGREISVMDLESNKSVCDNETKKLESHFVDLDLDSIKADADQEVETLNREITQEDIDTKTDSNKTDMDSIIEGGMLNLEGGLELEEEHDDEKNLEQLSFVDISTSDLNDIEVSTGKDESVKPVKYNMKFEQDENECEAFSVFVDRISILDDTSNEYIDVQDIEVSEELMLQYMKKRQHHKHLKMSLRNGGWGMKHGIRQALWFRLCHHLHKADDYDIFSEFAQDLFSPGDHADIRIPSFVDLEHLNSYHLNTDGIHTAKQILCVLEHSCPDIIHSPVLFPTLCIFLHYMDTSQCYNSLYALLRHKDKAFLPTTKVSYEASKHVIRDLARKYVKSCYVQLVRNCSNVDQVFESWVWWIFEDLPFSYLVRIMDCYLQEGVKVFYRVTLAILILFSKSTTKNSSNPKKDSGTSNILTSLRQFCREVPVRVDKLLKIAFSIRGLTRKEICRLQLKHEMYINSTKHMNNSNESQPGGHMTMSRSFSGPIVLQNQGMNTLAVDMLYTLLKWIPTRYAICQPELLYTSEEHGTSLVTLYQRVENYQPTIIVIKTTQDEVFGAFCSAYWRERRQKTALLSYFGTGETFVFTLTPEKRKFGWVGLTQENIPNTASMFQAGDRTILTVGGGHGEAISLDENLLHCHSAKCDTFDNEPLSRAGDCQCTVVEVYGFL